MAFTYTTINGQRVEVNVANAFQRMRTDFKRDTGCDLYISSGTRTAQEQINIFLSRYVTAANVRGRKVYDTRTWNGVLYYRISSAGTVAVPRTSNHEEGGPNGPRSIDIRDSGSDSGVTVRGSSRDLWMQRNASKYGFENEGYNFGEPWHKTYRGTIGGGGGSSTSGKLAVDGQWGPATTRALQKALGVTQDGEIGSQTVKALQKKLIAAGHNIAADGEMGPATIKALQTFILGSKYADGEIGPQTVKALQNYLNGGGTFTIAKPAPAPSGKLDVDGDWGPATTKALQKLLGVTQDGEIGPATTKALQKAFGIPEDGDWGPQTTRALQTWLGVKVDGEIGLQTTKALQTALNAGKKLAKVTVPDAPKPDPKPSTPAATVRTPVYPGAAAGWNVPLGQSKRSAGAVIRALIIHHETAFSSQVSYFKTLNDRSSCPTWEVNGKTVTEMIDPAMKPSATGAANDYSVAIETTNISGEPDWKVSEDSIESIIQIAVWLVKLSRSASPYFTAPDGTKVKVAIEPTREHIFGHKEAGINATRCPGEFLMSRMDAIVAEVQRRTAPAPTPEPQPGGDFVQVPRSELIALHSWLEALLVDGE